MSDVRHERVGRRISDHVFYWMPLILGITALLGAIYGPVGAYWQLHEEVKLLEQQVAQLVKDVSKLSDQRAR